MRAAGTAPSGLGVDALEEASEGPQLCLPRSHCDGSGPRCGLQNRVLGRTRQPHVSPRSRMVLSCPCQTEKLWAWGSWSSAGETGACFGGPSRQGEPSCPLPGEASPAGKAPRWGRLMTHRPPGRNTGQAGPSCRCWDPPGRACVSVCALQTGVQLGPEVTHLLGRREGAPPGRRSCRPVCTPGPPPPTFPGHQEPQAWSGLAGEPGGGLRTFLSSGLCWPPLTWPAAPCSYSRLLHCSAGPRVAESRPRAAPLIASHAAHTQHPPWGLQPAPRPPPPPREGHRHTPSS